MLVFVYDKNVFLLSTGRARVLCYVTCVRVCVGRGDVLCYVTYIKTPDTEQTYTSVYACVPA